MDEVDIHFIKNDEDPEAYNHFKKFFPISRLMKKYYENEQKKKEKKEEAKHLRKLERRMKMLIFLESEGLISLEELGDLDELLESDYFYERIGYEYQTIKEMMTAAEGDENVDIGNESDDDDDSDNADN